MTTLKFDPSAVLASRPNYEKLIGLFSPSWEVKRMQSRVQKHLFEYQAAQADRIFSPKTNGVPSESFRTQRDRVTMLWEARDLVENFSPAKQILTKFAENIAPSEYAPTTGNRNYDQQVSDFFHDWCRRCDFEGRHGFKKLMEIAVQTRPVDGDCGFILRRLADGELRLQLVAGDRIGNPQESTADNNYFSGITVDEYGRPLSYRIFRVSRNGSYGNPEEITRDNFFHFTDAFRPDQYRGISDFHSCLRTARMIKDILEAEQVGVKFASQQAALIFNSTGAPPARNLFTSAVTDTLPNGENRQQEYSEFGVLRYLSHGDKVEVMPSRPGSSFQGFTDMLMNHFAMGVGVAPGVLFGTQDYQGPSVRAEFAQADRTFSRHKANLAAKVLDPIRDAVLLNAISTGELPPPEREPGESPLQAIKRALRGSFRFPSKLTIDVGRESDANINEQMVGMKSLQEIAAEQDADAFTRLEQNAQVAAEVGRLATKYGVPETAIRLLGKQLPSTPAAAAAQGNAIGASAAEAQVASTSQPAAAQPSEPATNNVDLQKAFQADALIMLADGSYIPTDAMVSNAKRALAVREKATPSNRGMTAVGLARARDIINKRPLSEDTVRRMKAYFDRHEIDKQGSTWDTQGKGWQAWYGWGGDQGRAWANAIVERLNKADTRTHAGDETPRVELSAKMEVERMILGKVGQEDRKQSADEWLNAVIEYRGKFASQLAAVSRPIINGRSIIELSKKSS